MQRRVCQRVCQSCVCRMSIKAHCQISVTGAHPLPLRRRNLRAPLVIGAAAQTQRPHAAALVQQDTSMPVFLLMHVCCLHCDVVGCAQLSASVVFEHTKPMSRGLSRALSLTDVHCSFRFLLLISGFVLPLRCCFPHCMPFWLHKPSSVNQCFRMCVQRWIRMGHTNERVCDLSCIDLQKRSRQCRVHAMPSWLCFSARQHTIH